MKGKKLSPDIEALNDVLEALGGLTTEDEKRWVLETAANRVGLASPTQTRPERRILNHMEILAPHST